MHVGQNCYTNKIRGSIELRTVIEDVVLREIRAIRISPSARWTKLLHE